MKTLLIVRHAKSSWDNPNFSDYERPLNSRGERDAPYMAKVIKDKGINADIIISSPAVRALTTAKAFAAEQKIDESKIIIKELIYNSGFSEILRMLKKSDDVHNTIMLFGHNPDITHLSSYLSGNYFDNVHTCGVVCIAFPNVDKWANIDDQNGILSFYEYPRKYFSK